LPHKRYRIETVFSQLTDRFHAKKVWARIPAIWYPGGCGKS
jgi:hypothetical protein